MIYRTMFVPKVRLFAIVNWFVNLILIDKHGTKNLLGLTRSWIRVGGGGMWRRVGDEGQ